MLTLASVERLNSLTHHLRAVSLMTAIAQKQSSILPMCPIYSIHHNRNCHL